MNNRTTYDPEKFNLDVARIKKNGETFEVVVDPESAIAFKEGSLKDVKLVIKSEKIFFNAQKGELAPEHLFIDVFKTNDILKIAEIILIEGEVCLTAEHRKKEIERKKKQIIHIIHKNGVDPKTNYPHTLVRIEDAFLQCKAHVDEFKTAEEQVRDVLKKMQVLLPIKFEVKVIEIVSLPQYSHSCYGYANKVGKIIKSIWSSNQSWSGVIEIPGGLEEEFHDSLNKLSKGTVQTKITNIK